MYLLATLTTNIKYPKPTKYILFFHASLFFTLSPLPFK